LVFLIHAVVIVWETLKFILHRKNWVRICTGNNCVEKDWVRIYIGNNCVEL